MNLEAQWNTKLKSLGLGVVKSQQLKMVQNKELGEAHKQAVRNGRRKRRQGLWAKTQNTPQRTSDSNLYGTRQYGQA